MTNCQSRSDSTAAAFVIVTSYSFHFSSLLRPPYAHFRWSNEGRFLPRGRGGEAAQYRASTGRQSDECERDRYEHNLDEIANKKPGVYPDVSRENVS